MKQIGPWKFVFSTGRKIEFGIIGLDYRLDCIYDGYDGSLNESAGYRLTPGEQIEVADHMIDLWGKFRQKTIERLGKESKCSEST